jgi:cytidine deaminase
VSDEVVEALVESARAARDKAYAPYSEYKVGAAVMSASGKIYVGCNVENASYGATLCAERAAIAKMVSAGETQVVSVATFVAETEPAMPCGICRQVIAEFGPHAEVIAATPVGLKRTSADMLLPSAFVLSNRPPSGT